MSMHVAEQLRRERTRVPGRVRTVVRVHESGRHVGDILLDGKMRVWRHGDDVPVDVVLKTLVALSRNGEMAGQLVGRSDGLLYAWSVVGDLD